MNKNRRKKEEGEVMLEGMIVMVVVLFMLVWLLGLGFLYYQRYIVRIVTNDAAKKIAATYNAPTSDIIMGYISSDSLADRALCATPGLEEINKGRAESYVRYILQKANFAGTVEEADIKLEHVSDGLGRSHVVLTTTCTFNTPFGLGLSFMGGDETAKYRVTAYADSTYMVDYTSAVTAGKYFVGGKFLDGMGFVEDVYKLINSFMKCHNAWTTGSNAIGGK